MSVSLDGVSYFSADDVAERAGVSRQTLWRWRQEGHVPSGHRYRGKRLLFSEAEFQAVLDFAHRLEPADVRPSGGGEDPSSSESQRLGG